MCILKIYSLQSIGDCAEGKPLAPDMLLPMITELIVVISR